MAGNLDGKLRLPRTHFRVLLHAANMRHETNGFTSLPKAGVLRFFSPWKFRRLRPGLNPSNLGTKGQHADSRPPMLLDGTLTNEYFRSINVYCLLIKHKIHVSLSLKPYRYFQHAMNYVFFLLRHMRVYIRKLHRLRLITAGQPSSWAITSASVDSVINLTHCHEQLMELCHILIGGNATGFGFVIIQAFITTVLYNEVFVNSKRGW